MNICNGCACSRGDQFISEVVTSGYRASASIFLVVLVNIKGGDSAYSHLYSVAVSIVYICFAAYFTRAISIASDGIVRIAIGGILMGDCIRMPDSEECNG